MSEAYVIEFSLKMARILPVQGDETIEHAVERHLDSLDTLSLEELVRESEIVVTASTRASDDE